MDTSPYLDSLKIKLMHAKEFHPSKVAYYEQLIKEWIEHTPNHNPFKAIVNYQMSLSFYLSVKHNSKVNYLAAKDLKVQERLLRDLLCLPISEDAKQQIEAVLMDQPEAIENY